MSRSEPVEAAADELPAPVDPRRVSRRLLLRHGTLGAAALGVVSAVPGLSGLLTGASSAAPEVTGAASETAPEAASLGAVDGPLVAHITNAATGDVSLFVGEREIPFRDPTLVQHLLRSAR